MKPKYKLVRTIADVRQAAEPIIYYAVHTCWWSESCMHYQLKVMGRGLPCDPRGSVLMEAHDPAKFLGNAEENPAHYGRHGLRAFEAALHGNVTVGGLPTSFSSWEEYNQLLDEHDAEARPDAG